jgi:hypothetical protein
VSAAGTIVVDSVTHLGERGHGQVVVSGSHGGRYSALYSVGAGAVAVVLNDAGVGKDGAGISGLEAMQELGLGAAVVSYLSARIGDAGDTLRNGTISHCNEVATAAGVRPDMAAAEAVELLAAAAGAPAADNPTPELRPLRLVEDMEPPTVVCDSMSQAREDQAGRVVVSGSHGGDMGGRHAPPGLLAAFFNDAGSGKERAGIARLPLLDEMGIAAATAGHLSARIGDGEDTLRSGKITHVNRHGEQIGLRPGVAVEAAVRGLAASEASKRRGEQGA